MLSIIIPSSKPPLSLRSHRLVRQPIPRARPLWIDWLFCSSHTPFYRCGWRAGGGGSPHQSEQTPSPLSVLFNKRNGREVRMCGGGGGGTKTTRERQRVHTVLIPCKRTKALPNQKASLLALGVTTAFLSFATDRWPWQPIGMPHAASLCRQARHPRDFELGNVPKKEREIRWAQKNFRFRILPKKGEEFDNWQRKKTCHLVQINQYILRRAASRKKRPPYKCTTCGLLSLSLYLVEQEICWLLCLC